MRALVTKFRSRFWALSVTVVLAVVSQSAEAKDNWVGHFYTGGAYYLQNERVLADLNNTYGDALNYRTDYSGFEVTGGYMWHRRLWPEINLYYFDRGQFSSYGTGLRFLFTYFYRKHFPVSLHFFTGGGYGIINPDFLNRNLWDAQLNFGTGFRYRTWRLLFGFDFEYVVVIMDGFRYTAQNRLFESGGREILRYKFSVTYRL